MKNKKLIVTGRGLINPAGNSLNDFWNHILSEKICYGKLNIKDDTPIKVGARVKDFNPVSYISKRIEVKTDTFTHYFLASLSIAMKEAGLTIHNENEDEVGIFYGNNSGGWRICEKGFDELFTQSYAMVNPWQATAWFPTAGEGYASIIHGIKGYSKTFVADRVSSAAAVYHGIASLQNSRNKKILVGGSEAPLTGLGTICYNENGSISNAISEELCKPFVSDSPGIVLSEGGAAIVIETSDNANSLGIAQIKGYATNYYATNQVEGVVACMNRAIWSADLETADIDLIIPEGNGDWESDRIEIEAMRALFIHRPDKLPIAFPKCYFGHQYGAAAVSDVICACMALEYNAIPQYRFIDEIDELFTDKLTSKINNVLVNSRTSAGVNYSFIISRIEN